MSKVVIAGAGPAGLTAAYKLAKLGSSSTILESDQQVGGISRTVNYRGYRFDIGGHRFFSKVPLVNEIWDDILGESFLWRPRMSRIHYRGRYFDYPLKAGNALMGLGAWEAMRIGCSYAKYKLSPSPTEATFEQWVCNRFGKRLYEIFFKTYTEKVWGIPCNEISADWAAQRIKNLSLTEALRNAILGDGKSKDGQVITTLIDKFKYPRLGPGMMWERCEDLMNQKGNRTLRGVRVEKFRHRNGRVECAYGRDAKGEKVEFSGDQFLSTLPLRELIHSFDPLPPAEVVRAADGLRYRDFLTVVLIVKRDDLFPDNWIYIHSPDVKMGRIQNYKNWSPEMVPDPSMSSLGLEYFLWDTDDLWNWDDQRLIELGTQECAKIGMIEPGEVKDGTVVRMKKAYPVYDQAYPEHLAVVRSYLETFKNFQTVGRNGQHRYNNQDHSMLTAVYAARNIEGEKHDVWSVNVDKEYHEEDRKPTERSVPSRVAQPEEELLTAEQMIEEAFAMYDPVAMGVAMAVVSGFTIFVASAVLLVKGGEVVGPTLSLLGYFLIGYEVNWPGAVIGILEAGALGYLLGYLGAWMTNSMISMYMYLVKWRVESQQTRDLLEQLR